MNGPAGSDGPLVLDLDATELSWVVVQVDAGSPQEALLRPGEKAQWKAQDQFMVTLGNAGGVRAELNGKAAKAFWPEWKSRAGRGDQALTCSAAWRLSSCAVVPARLFFNLSSTVHSLK